MNDSTALTRRERPAIAVAHPPRFKGLSGSSDGARQALAAFWAAVGRQLPSSLISRGESHVIELSPAGKLPANLERGAHIGRRSTLDIAGHFG